VHVVRGHRGGRGQDEEREESGRIRIQSHLTPDTRLHPER
jgi:hypothetical protein